MTYSYDDSSIFHMFFNVCIHSSSFLLCADWWKSDSSADKEPLENWRQNSNSKDVVAGWLYFYKEEKSKIYRRERRVCITAWWTRPSDWSFQPVMSPFSPGIVCWQLVILSPANYKTDFKLHCSSELEDSYINFSHLIALDKIIFSFVSYPEENYIPP